MNRRVFLKSSGAVAGAIATLSPTQLLAVGGSNLLGVDDVSKNLRVSHCQIMYDPLRDENYARGLVRWTHAGKPHGLSFGFTMAPDRVCVNSEMLDHIADNLTIQQFRTTQSFSRNQVRRELEAGFLNLKAPTV